MPSRKVTYDSLVLLKEAGYDVKPQLMDYVRHQELERKGIVQHWRCIPCQQDYFSLLEATGVDCSRSHAMKLVWKLGEV